MNRTAYRFVSLAPGLTDYGHNKLYVEAFLGAMNDHDYQRHALKLGADGKPLPPHTHGWSYGLQPRHNDGRVTTRRTSWVYAKAIDAAATGDMPEAACALVYFTTEAEPIGYLVKVEPVRECRRCSAEMEPAPGDTCPRCRAERADPETGHQRPAR